MTTTVRSGEEPFPAFPRVSLELPAGWQPMPNPEVIVAAAASQWQGFRPNVCVTVERVEGVAELDEVGRNTWERFSHSPEFFDAGHGAHDGFGGHPSYRMEGSFLMPDAGTLFQACALTVIPHAAVNDIVYAVGTGPLMAEKNVLQDIRTIIGSARFLDEVSER